MEERKEVMRFVQVLLIIGLAGVLMGCTYVGKNCVATNDPNYEHCHYQWHGDTACNGSCQRNQ